MADLPSTPREALEAAAKVAHDLALQSGDDITKGAAVCIEQAIRAIPVAEPKPVEAGGALDALIELHRECIIAAKRAGTTWPLSGPAKALDARCRAAMSAGVSHMVKVEKTAFTYAFAAGFEAAENTSRRCTPAMDDAWDEYQAIRGVSQATPDPLTSKLVEALREQHAWHLAQTTPDPEHGYIPADEYGDSCMCERTMAALAAAEGRG